jgi:ribosomal protein RSM22 (predicted rRNA methylase)
MTAFNKEKLSSLLSTIQEKDLRKASQELTALYHAGTFAPKLSKNQYLAYLAVRMPATYAVALKVFTLLNEYPFSIRSYLDLGAGPGTATIAASVLFPNLEKVTLIEQDKEFLKISKQLLENKNESIFFEWQEASLENASFPSSDLVAACYSLGELGSKERLFTLDKMWQQSTQAVVIIEPGTPRGYETILEARENLIKKGALILAPCPHQASCPLEKPDWCHFSEKLDRSPLHRRTKSASLGFEEEKYAYILASHHPFQRSFARVLRPPLKRSGHVILDLCAQDGVKRKTFSKRDGDLYRQGRDVQWGEEWPFSDSEI